MKTSRYIEAQILAILRQAEGGMPVAELCRAHGTSSASFYKWRAQYGGMDASLISQMKVMEEENRRLRRMYADLSMRADLLSSGVPQGQHCAGLPGLWCQRDLLSLWPKVTRRERGNRGSSGRPDGRQEDLGVRAVFPAPAQRRRSSVEPQTRLLKRMSDLLCMSDPVHASSKGSMHDDLQGTSG